MKPAPVRQAGYTIIETMIFLIISGALLLGALGLFNGRIQRTQFSQAVQAFDSRIKTAANEVSTGTYPDNQPFSCSIAPDGSPSIAALGTAEQGTRSDCIFVGKVIAPAASCKSGVKTIAQVSCTTVEVHTVIGRRLDNTGKVTSILVDPTNIGTGAKPVMVTNPDLTQSIDLGYGTSIKGVYLVTAGSPSLLSGIGFFQSFNGSYDNNGNLASGAQNIQTWNVKTTTLTPISPLIRNDMATTIHKEKMTQATPGSTIVCLRSGSNDQNASITLGNSNGALTTNVVVGDPLCP